MTGLTGRIGTAPRRCRDKAVFAALKVGATVFPLCLLALTFFAPIRAQYGRDAEVIGITHFSLWFGGSWFDVALELRFGAAMLIAIAASAFAARQAWTRTPLIERIGLPHHDDPALHYGVYASRRMQAEFDDSYGSRSKRGLWLAPGVRMPFEAETQFILVVGDKGSGKSNIVRSLASQMAQRGDHMLFDLAPCLPPFITRVRSGSGPVWTGLQTRSG